jgi:hypothetical protein
MPGKYNNDTGFETKASARENAAADQFRSRTATATYVRVLGYQIADEGSTFRQLAVEVLTDMGRVTKGTVAACNLGTVNGEPVIDRLINGSAESPACEIGAILRLDGVERLSPDLLSVNRFKVINAQSDIDYSAIVDPAVALHQAKWDRPTFGNAPVNGFFGNHPITSGTETVEAVGDVEIRVIGYLLNTRDPAASVLAAELVGDAGSIGAGTPVRVTMLDADNGNRLISDLYHGTRDFGVERCETGARITLSGAVIRPNGEIDAKAYTVLDPMSDLPFEEVMDPATFFPGIEWKRPQASNSADYDFSLAHQADVKRQKNALKNRVVEARVLGYSIDETGQHSMMAVELIDTVAEERNVHPGTVIAVHLGNTYPPVDVRDIRNGSEDTLPAEIGARIRLKTSITATPWQLRPKTCEVINPRSDFPYDVLPDPHQQTWPRDIVWERPMLHDFRAVVKSGI